MPEPRELLYERSHISLIEDVMKRSMKLPLEMLVKQSLQSSWQVREEWHNQLEALQKYVNMLLDGDKEN